MTGAHLAVKAAQLLLHIAEQASDLGIPQV